MRPPIFLLAIFAGLTCTNLGRADDNNLALGDSNSAMLSPVLVAGAGEGDFGDPLGDLQKLPGYLMHNLADPEPATQSKPDPEPTAPERSPDPIPKPDCLEYNDDYTAVCCIEEPEPFPNFPPYLFWSLVRCAQGNPHIFICSLSSMSGFPTRSLR